LYALFNFEKHWPRERTLIIFFSATATVDRTAPDIILIDTFNSLEGASMRKTIVIGCLASFCLIAVVLQGCEDADHSSQPANSKQANQAITRNAPKNPYELLQLPVSNNLLLSELAGHSRFSTLGYYVYLSTLNDKRAELTDRVIDASNKRMRFAIYNQQRCIVSPSEYNLPAAASDAVDGLNLLVYDYVIRRPDWFDRPVDQALAGAYLDLCYLSPSANRNYPIGTFSAAFYSQDARDKDQILNDQKIAVINAQRLKEQEIIPNPDIPAKIIAGEQPKYPGQAIRLHHMGTTIVDITVTSAGSIADLRVKDSSGYSELDRAAINAARSWRFSPASKDNGNVWSTVSVPINFGIENTHQAQQQPTNYDASIQNPSAPTNPSRSDVTPSNSSNALTNQTENLGTLQSTTPSFDCAKASTPTEVSICSSPSLIELDNDLAKAYHAAFSQSMGDSRQTLVYTQRRWIKDRQENCKNNIECIQQSTETRIKQLTVQ